MEILSYLRLTGRRVVGLTMIAGLAGAGAGYAVTRSPASYQATATVFVGQALPPGSSSFDLPSLVADFTAALSLHAVLEAAAEAADLPLDSFLITADRNGEGGSVRVTAQAPTAEAAEDVASAISVEAMRFITTRQVDRATSLETQRRDEADAARTALAELDAENGFVNPVTQYAAVQAEVTQLQLAGQLEQAQALRDSLPQLAAKAQAYQAASSTLTDADATASAATRDRVAAEAVRSAATSPEAVAEDQADPVSPTPAIMRAAGAAVLVTAGVGVGTLALLDDRRRRRTERRATRQAATAAAAEAAEADGPEPDRGTTADAGGAHADVEAADDVDDVEGEPSGAYDPEADDVAPEAAPTQASDIALTGAARGRG